MKLKSTRKEFTFSDESGYSFEVVAVLDSEYGWSASCTVSSSGYKTDTAAIKSLVPSLEKLIEMIRRGPD